MGFGKQVARAGKDPWLLVTSGVGGGLAWAVLPAVGLAGTIAGPVGLGIGVAMWGIGAVVGALSTKDEDAWHEAEEIDPRIRPGTQQATLVRSLRGYVRDLEALRASPLPDSVLDQAITALVAAQGAEDTALRVAAAVDGLDDALKRSRRPPGQEPRGGALQAVQRMAERRHALLTKLQHGVDGVAEVYTELLELRANVAALDVGEVGDELETVRASLDALRGSLAELEEERRALP
jgi:hypothetical protein